MEGDPHYRHRGHDDCRRSHRRHPGLYLSSVPSIPWPWSACRWLLTRPPGWACWVTISWIPALASTMHINRGAGAFVCGEGSALTASIEGKRGMPRTKPPRTVGSWPVGQAHRSQQCGNLCQCAPAFLSKGAGWYRSIGTETSSGTKTFALTGNVVNTGLVEVPMGTTLAGNHLRHRRRHPRRQEVQGRADRRPRRRLPHRGASGPAPWTLTP